MWCEEKNSIIKDAFFFSLLGFLTSRFDSIGVRLCNSISEIHLFSLLSHFNFDLVPYDFLWLETTFDVDSNLSFTKVFREAGLSRPIHSPPRFCHYHQFKWFLNHWHSWSSMWRFECWRDERDGIQERISHSQKHSETLHRIVITFSKRFSIEFRWVRFEISARRRRHHHQMCNSRHETQNCLRNAMENFHFVKYDDEWEKFCNEINQNLTSLQLEASWKLFYIFLKILSRMRQP